MVILVKAIKIDEGKPSEITYFEAIGPFATADEAWPFTRPGMAIVPLISPNAHIAEVRLLASPKS